MDCYLNIVRVAVIVAGLFMVTMGGVLITVAWRTQEPVMALLAILFTVGGGGLMASQIDWKK